MTQTIFRYLPILALSVLPTSGFAQDVTGVWRTESTEQGYLEVEISRCADAFCGTVVGARDLQGVAGSHPAVGRQMIRDMKPDSDAGSWGGGRIWDPRTDRNYNVNMSLKNGRLSVAGCVLGLCEAQVWQRVQ